MKLNYSNAMRVCAGQCLILSLLKRMWTFLRSKSPKRKHRVQWSECGCIEHRSVFESAGVRTDGVCTWSSWFCEFDSSHDSSEGMERERLWSASENVDVFLDLRVLLSPTTRITRCSSEGYVFKVDASIHPRSSMYSGAVGASVQAKWFSLRSWNIGENFVRDKQDLACRDDTGLIHSYMTKYLFFR